MSIISKFNKEEHMFLKNLSYVATIFIFLLLLIIWIADFRKTYDDKEYEKFMVLLGQYDQAVSARNNCFKKMYDAWANDNDFRAQKLKESNSLDFILWRLNNKEPFVDIEYELLVNEVQCMSYMNRLCEIALYNKRASEIIRLRESYELYFYNNHFGDVQKLYNSYKESLKLRSLSQDNIRNVFNGNVYRKPWQKRAWFKMCSCDND